MKKSMNYIFFVILVSINMPLIKTMNIAYAIQGGYYEEVKNLLEQRKKTQGDYSLNNETGNFYLQTAIEGNFKYIVELLLECGAELDTGDSLLQTPLHFAVRYGRKEIVSLLIERNAQINVKDGFGLTPLYYAVQRNNSAEIIKLLVQKGANVDEMVLDIERQEKPEVRQRRVGRLHINWKPKVLLSVMVSLKKNNLKK